MVWDIYTFSFNTKKVLDNPLDKGPEISLWFPIRTNYYELIINHMWIWMNMTSLWIGLFCCFLDEDIRNAELILSEMDPLVFFCLNLISSYGRSILLHYQSYLITLPWASLLKLCMLNFFYLHLVWCQNFVKFTFYLSPSSFLEMETHIVKIWAGNLIRKILIGLCAFFLGSNKSGLFLLLQLFAFFASAC